MNADSADGNNIYPRYPGKSASKNRHVIVPFGADRRPGCDELGEVELSGEKRSEQCALSSSSAAPIGKA